MHTPFAWCIGVVVFVGVLEKPAIIPLYIYRLIAFFFQIKTFCILFEKYILSTKYKKPFKSKTHYSSQFVI